MKYFSSFLAKILCCLMVMVGSCTQISETPFPKELTEALQPERVPLELTEPQPLHWDTLKKGTITPTVFPLDFKKMKSLPFDSTGFQPMAAPTETSFDFGSLPSKTFDLESIPAHPLKMKWETLPPPGTSIEILKPSRVINSVLDLRVIKEFSSRGIINSIVKNEKGLLFIGTSKGLYIYDGIKLTLLIPSVNVAGCVLDKNDSLWFVERRGVNFAICRLDLKNRLIGKGEIPYTLSASLINMKLDASGRLWLQSTQASPPLVINLSKNIYRALDQKTGLLSAAYYHVSIDEENRIWLSSRNGIDIIDLDKKRISNLGMKNGLSADTIRSLIISGGRIFATGPHGVDQIDIKRGKITHYQVEFLSSLYSIIVDKPGQLWIGTDHGLYIVNFKNNTYRHIGKENGLPDSYILKMLENSDGEVLLASTDGSNANVSLIGQYGKTVFPLKATGIISSTEDSKGNLWLGTETGIIVADSLRKQYWEIDTSNGLANKYVQSITQENGKIIITTNGGFNIFDPERNEIQRVGKKEGLVADTVYSLIKDARGNPWITGSFSGIIQYDIAGKYILAVNSKGGLNGNFVVQALPLNDKKMIIVTQESGPCIIDISTNTIQFIKKPEALNGIAYKSIMLDKQGRVWISGTDNWGLYAIDFNNKSILRFTKKEGLSDNSVSSVLEYNGRLLVTQNKKVNIITPPESSSSHKWEIGVLKYSKGLEKSYGSFFSDAITKRGNYLWGDQGLGVIYGIEPDTSKYVDFVSGIRLMDKEINFAEREGSISKDTLLKNLQSLSLAGYTEKSSTITWDSLSAPYNMPVNLSLPADQNVLQFQLTEQNFGRPDSIEYAYILDGIDKNWTYTNEGETETYLNLAPGNYTFKVRSLWSSGRWSEPAVMSFTIRPPWYNTWWAYLIYIVGGLILLRLYLNFRSRKLKRENKILEEKVTQRTEELQQSYNNVEQLGQVGRKITSSLSVEKIIGTVYKNVNLLMDAEVFGIGIYQSETESLDFPATHENGLELAPYSNSIHDENRFGSICYNSDKEIVMSDLGEQYKDYIQQLPDPKAGQQAVSLIYLPLTISQKKLGVITVQSFKKNAYSENHLNMLRNIANYTAIALENAESYSKLNQSLENLKETQKQLIQSEKMASLGELTAGIAHEIQNPLNFVNNFSEINGELIAEMVEGIDKGEWEEVRSLANDILENEKKINHHGRRADGIVKGMLQHSRKSTGIKEPVDINSLADEYLRLSYHGLRAKDKSFNANFKLEPDESIGKISIVAQDMGRVLLNLFNNAFYAVKQKKLADKDGYEPKVNVTTKKNDESVIITVKDNGSGIPKEVVDKIFQPFFTTKPTGEGTGLGLSLSYDIIKAHGGTLKVVSKENEGTEFMIELPVV